MAGSTPVRAGFGGGIGPPSVQTAILSLNNELKKNNADIALMSKKMRKFRKPIDFPAQFFLMSAGTNTEFYRSLTLSDSNGISFGITGGTITASHNGLTSQSNQAVSAANGSYAFQTLSFSNANGISFGTSAGSAITGSYTVPTVTNSSMTVSDAATSGTLARLAFTNLNGVTLSLSSGAGGSHTIVGSHNAITSQSTQYLAITLGGNTAGTTTFHATNNASIFLHGGNNITLSGNGNSITISAGAGGGAANTIYGFEPYPFQGTGTGSISLSSNTSAVQMMVPFTCVENVAAEWLGVILSMNFTTGGTSSFRQSGTLHYGIFTRAAGVNSTRLSALTSGTFSYGVTYNNSTITLSHPTSTNSTGYGYGSTSSAGLNITSGYTGLKSVGLALGTTLSPGVYWLGLHHRNSSSSFNSGLRMSLFGNSVTMTALAPMGSFTSAFSTGTNLHGLVGGNWNQYLGSYSDGAGQTGLATDVTISQMTGNLTVKPYMKFISRGAAGGA